MSLVLFLSVLSISAAPSTRGIGIIGVVGDNCISFRVNHYTVMENVRTFEVEISIDKPVDYSIVVFLETEDGTANADSDYIGFFHTFILTPGQVYKYKMVEIIDDNQFEEDEHFYIRARTSGFGTEVLTVMILDDDHGSY